MKYWIGVAGACGCAAAIWIATMSAGLGAAEEVSRAYQGSLTPEQLVAIAAGNLDRVPGRLLVKFKADATSGQRDAAVSRLSAAAHRLRPLYADFDIVELGAGGDPDRSARDLEASGLVEYAEPDYLLKPQYVPNDPGFRSQWNLSLVGVDKAWDISPGGSESVIVAVIDSGVAMVTDTWTMKRYDGRQFVSIDVPLKAAPDLAAPGRFVKPWDFVWGDALPADFGGHGTHVAGTIAQTANNGQGQAGVAFNSRLMPLKVCWNAWDLLFLAASSGIRLTWVDPESSGCDTSSVAQALRYAVDNGARVINMSLGSPSQSQVQLDAIRYATSRGAVVVMSAGNAAMQGSPTSYPAAYASNIDGAIAVGAVDRNSRRAYYSNVGSYVEFVAPGGDVRSGGANGITQQTLDDYYTDTIWIRPRFDVFLEGSYQGTSMAAPHVAGVVALMLSQGYSNPATIEASLRYYAKDLGSPGRDSEYGYGLVDARAVLRGMGAAR